MVVYNPLRFTILEVQGRACNRGSTFTRALIISSCIVTLCTCNPSGCFFATLVVTCTLYIYSPKSLFAPGNV